MWAGFIFDAQVQIPYNLPHKKGLFEYFVSGMDNYDLFLPEEKRASLWKETYRPEQSPGKCSK